MRFIVSLFVIILCHTAVMAYTVETYRPTQMSGMFDGAYGEYTGYPKMTKIENILFNQGYESENIYLRLSRAEKKIFNRNYPQADLNWRMENILSQIDTTAMYDIPSAELAAIEQRVLGRKYTREKAENRIARLEQQMFGTLQGGNVDERYQMVRNAAMSYNNIASAASPMGGYYPSQYPITQTGVKGALRNILGSMVGSALPFGGMMTGFTPPMVSSPYCYDPSGYNNAGSGMNRWYSTNNGFYNQNNSYGTGSGVTILDN